jgi:hypothetical protein
VPRRTAVSRRRRELDVSPRCTSSPRRRPGRYCFRLNGAASPPIGRPANDVGGRTTRAHCPPGSGSTMSMCVFSGAAALVERARTSSARRSPVVAHFRELLARWLSRPTRATLAARPGVDETGSRAERTPCSARRGGRHSHPARLRGSPHGVGATAKSVRLPRQPGIDVSALRFALAPVGRRGIRGRMADAHALTRR